jgi:hypothetical protein
MVSSIDPLTSYAVANVLEACLGVAYVSNIIRDIMSCIVQTDRYRCFL